MILNCRLVLAFGQVTLIIVIHEVFISVTLDGYVSRARFLPKSVKESNICVNLFSTLMYIF